LFSYGHKPEFARDGNQAKPAHGLPKCLELFHLLGKRFEAVRSLTAEEQIAIDMSGLKGKAHVCRRFSLHIFFEQYLQV
jgi:hypothetical protein